MNCYSLSLSSEASGTNKFRESFCKETCTQIKKDRLYCDCGENLNIFDWGWGQQIGNPMLILSHDSRKVVFHPVYSSGTSVVKGSEPLKQNAHHYWEVKVLTNLYGTDIMIGVGTSKFDLMKCQFKFCSMLGYDAESWGFSYHGFIQHNRLRRAYGLLYGMGSIIGVHLDMYTGNLEYYLNRKPLGVAFKGLKGKELYAMISSTAAQSSVKLTSSLTLDSTLQMKCLMVIKNHPNLIKQYHSIPGLPRLIKEEYFWLIPPEMENMSENELTLEDEVVLSQSTKMRKRLRSNRWSVYEDRADPDHISYRDFFRKCYASRLRKKNKHTCRVCCKEHDEVASNSQASVELQKVEGRDVNKPSKTKKTRSWKCKTICCSRFNDDGDSNVDEGGCGYAWISNDDILNLQSKNSLAYHMEHLEPDDVQSYLATQEDIVGFCEICHSNLAYKLDLSEKLVCTLCDVD